MDKTKHLKAFFALGSLFVVLVLIFLIVQCRQSYSVTFDTDGGNEIPAVSVNKDDTVARPQNPTKNGFTFAYWELDGEEFDFSQPITADIKLKAIWEAITYTVTFDSDGGSDVEAQVIAFGENANKPEDPIREGYSFIGWYLNEVEHDFSQVVEQDMHLLAMWEAITYTVTFDSDGGSDVEAQVIAFGENANKPEDPIREGYSFIGWYLNEVEHDFSQVVEQDMHLLAMWEAITYTVTFDSDGGSDVEAQVIAFGENANKPEDPIREGYSFIGWYLNEVEHDFSQVVEQDMHLLAMWEAITYTVTFDSDGGSDVEAQVIAFGENANKPEDPIREGYSFIGWYLNEVEHDFSQVVEQDMHLLAMWEAITYTVTFDSDGGSDVEAQVIAFGENANKPEDPIREGYSFIGWYLNEVEHDFSQVVEQDMHLLAMWEAITYTVTFDSDGGSDVEAQVIAFGENANKPEDPIREGYSFIGWYLNEVEHDFSQVVEQDMHLLAIWEAITYTVTFDSDGGSDVEAQVIAFGENANKPEDPIREGYSFIGWYLNEVEHDFSQVVEQDMHLLAMWEAKESVYTFGTHRPANFLGSPQVVVTVYKDGTAVSANTVYKNTTVLGDKNNDQGLLLIDESEIDGVNRAQLADGTFVNVSKGEQ